MIADQKYGHLAKDQEYQKDTIFMGWGATAKVENNFDTVSKPAQKPEAEELNIVLHLEKEANDR